MEINNSKYSKKESRDKSLNLNRISALKIKDRILRIYEVRWHSVQKRSYELDSFFIRKGDIYGKSI